MIAATLRLGALLAGALLIGNGSAMAQSSPASNETTSGAGQEKSQSQQTPEATQTPAPTLTIRETVRRVIVDVMVRDGNGKPVHGLKAGDFTLTEDKQPQRILSFDVYDFDKPSISRGPNARPLPPNVFVNVPDTPERGPLYVILYDLVNTEQEDQMTSRQQILKFIKSKPEGTRFAIFVNSDELFLAQGFTTDKDELFATLDSKHSKPHVPRIFLYGRNYGRGDPYAMVQTLTFIGSYLDGIPGRKNLIWVAGTFPVDIFPREGDPVNWQDQIRAEVNALAQAQVAVFPLDARGVVTNPEGALTGAMPHGGAGGQSPDVAGGSVGGAIGSSSMQPTGGNSAGGGPILTAMTAGHMSGSLAGSYMTQDAIATMTGGRALYSDNGLAEMLADATEDGGNYYTLTYSPSAQDDDGKCHNIAVQVDKSYQLSYRHTYCRIPLVSSVAEGAAQNAGPAALAIPLAAGDVLQANMKQGAPMVHDLVFSAHVRTEGAATMASAQQMNELQSEADRFLKRRKNGVPKPLPPVRIQTYMIDYRVLDPQFKMEAARGGSRAALEFAVAAFDAEGHMLNGVVNDGIPELSTDPSENKAGLYRVRQSLVVPVSAICIRVGVRDRASDRMGTVEVPLPLAPEPVTKASAAQ